MREARAMRIWKEEEREGIIWKIESRVLKQVVDPHVNRVFGLCGKYCYGYAVFLLLFHSPKNKLEVKSKKQKNN